ncbi:N-acetyltransferase family protein [Streptomyces sp. URMC 129]|uniref:GNAT family N-acetyltransferase n=1 Tax=Streptomyces sp. URMC 129 TaxID=3423407 RepID=UPI003F1A36B1
MRITIATGTPADADRVAALHAASWRTAYAGIMPDAFLAGPVEAGLLADWRAQAAEPAAGSALFLATGPAGDGAADGLYGFAHLFPVPDGRVLLDNLHARPGHTGAGIGRALLTHSLAWAATAHPGRDVFLEVLRDNAPAIGFYERMGGRRTGEGVTRFPAGFALPHLFYTWSPASVPPPRIDGSSSIQASTARS